MYRLTRILFSPLTYLMAAAVGYVIFTAAGGVVFVSSFSMILRVDMTEAFMLGLMTALWSCIASSGLLVASGLMLVVRAIIVEFWPGTRPWLYAGPPPHASLEGRAGSTKE
ncbi:hypothetical protein [Zestomonas carbonaria]|uniref:Uncharacterized protein n=1 Tax=Zestomonas carbonaria TaxID=2762745 RepID=A0A7U7ET77_9GAMM|nr:hypothetical protein [Pseudomonas carbonaria]CAD5110458.1 hypothetical protein PSEWESI4_04781 [Pseudomonas carbonaria]